MNGPKKVGAIPIISRIAGMTRDRVAHDKSAKGTASAIEAGVSPENIIFGPGIGLDKT